MRVRKHYRKKPKEWDAEKTVFVNNYSRNAFAGFKETEPYKSNVHKKQSAFKSEDYKPTKKTEIERGKKESEQKTMNDFSVGASISGPIPTEEQRPVRVQEPLVDYEKQEDEIQEAHPGMTPQEVTEEATEQRRDARLAAKYDNVYQEKFWRDLNSQRQGRGLDKLPFTFDDPVRFQKDSQKIQASTNLAIIEKVQRDALLKEQFKQKLKETKPERRKFVQTEYNIVQDIGDVMQEQKELERNSKLFELTKQKSAHEALIQSKVREGELHEEALQENRNRDIATQKKTIAEVQKKQETPRQDQGEAQGRKEKSR